jgi:hypothetical protein
MLFSPLLSGQGYWSAFAIAMWLTAIFVELPLMTQGILADLAEFLSGNAALSPTQSLTKRK